jgi:DNA (cytosine-5)-methyltransferase 1
MKYFSMFSGIGGFEYGIEKAIKGAECVGFSEIDKYAIAIYKYHFPTHTEFGDAFKIDPGTIPDFDLLCGGFPCQAFSIAGKRGGFEDTRGTLFFEIARIVSVKRPKFLLLENVKGLLSHDHGKTFGTILSTLSDLGYFLEWQVLNSKDFGVPQNRERVFIVGHLGGISRGQVFPIGEVGQNNPEQLIEGSQGYRVYSTKGLSTTLASQAGGGRSKNRTLSC